MYLVLSLSGIVVLRGLCRFLLGRIVGIAPRILPGPLPFVLGVVRSLLVWTRLAGIRGSIVGLVALPGAWARLTGVGLGPKGFKK